MFSSLYGVYVLLNLVVFFREAELQPTFTAEPPDPFTVLEGNNITLEWSYDLGGGSFRRIELRVITPPVLVAEVDDTGGLVPLDNGYTGRLQVNVTATQTSITILEANRTDSKDYVLQIHQLGSPTAGSEVTILVQYPPEFDRVSDNQTAVEGDPSITLECTAIGEPPPNITWTRVLDNGSDSSVLFTGEQFVLDSSRSSIGIYRCTASNGIGTAPSRTIAVDVNYEPENIVLMVNDSNVCKGDVITITCSADGKPSVHTYQLFENDIQVNDSEIDRVWTRTMSAQGNFTYRCVANNTVGTTDKNVTVTVNVPTVVYSLENITVTEGENRTLTCNVSGSPTLSVTWTEVKTGNRTMGITRELTHINRDESGEYKCEASNSCGNDTAITFLIVQYKPENFQFAASEIEVCQDKVINFNCSADGNPAVHNYQLLENDVLVTNGSNSHGMWNRTMSVGGSFIYKCVANNTAGTGQSESINVNVNEKPKNFQFAASGIEVCQDKVINFTCSSDGNPAVHTYQLFENDVLVTDGSNSHGMWNRNMSTGGVFIFKCMANNTAGTGESETITVTVNVPSSVQPIKNNTIIEGANVTLSCYASGTPPPMVSWIKVDSHQRIDGSELVFTNINRSEAGEYRCEANNECGNASVTTRIDAQFVPDNVLLETSAVDDKACRGDFISINCSADAVPPVTCYDLLENGSVILDTSGMWSRTLSSGGVFIYKCVANNSLGSTESESVTVTVNVPPVIHPIQDKTITEGDSVTLTCNASGIPSPIVSWIKVGSDMSMFNVGELELSNVARSEAGEYRCEASNECGSASETARIFVQFAPSIVPLGNMTVVNGGTVNLFCDTSGRPEPLVSWTQVSTGNKQFNKTWRITDFRERDIGEYRCDASNVYGKDSKSTFISLQGFLRTIPIEPEKVNKDVIYGTVIGTLFLLFSLFIIYITAKRRKGRGDNRLDVIIEMEPQTNEGMDIEGSNENVNNISQHPASQYMALVEVAQSPGGTGPKISPYSEINEYAPLHPGTRSWEVARENVIIEKIIGKGAFGQVAQGKASQLRGREETTTVAIKMLKDHPTEKERKDLLSELELMKKLKPHPHVIKLLGCVTESDPLLIIIEYVPYGDLLGYLRKSRGLNDTYFKDPDVKPQTSLTSQQLIKFSWQVADGMRYLSSKNIIHRDLAARNVLIGERETCKVTDFGMARDVNQENVYERKTKSRLPVKWTAYEALLFGRYTTKSDVWSFGIVLYEIFTIGGSPYPRMDARKMADILNRGYRMPRPSHVDEALYKIMQDCWREDPDDRPTFENLRDELKEMENQHQRLINMQDYDKKLYENVEDLIV